MVSMKNFNIVSLFSGAGCLDLVFKQAGFNIIYSAGQPKFNENSMKIQME